MLNFKVDDAGAAHPELMVARVQKAMALENHPLVDRRSSAIDPTGNSSYIYGREPHDELKQR